MWRGWKHQRSNNRERENLNLLGSGEHNTDISTALCISIRTVETHFSRIATKLTLDGVKAFRRYAVQRKHVSHRLKTRMQQRSSGITHRALRR